MKNKIYILIIAILIISIFGIQYRIHKTSNTSNLAINKSNNETGIVKSAKTSTSIDLHLPEISNIILSKFPIKKNEVKDPSVYAHNYVLMDEETGYLLVEKDSHEKVPIASTTKIMTAMLVLENYHLDDIVTISQNAASQIGSDINLRTNEKMTVRNLLYALLVMSGNDSAMALAEHIQGGLSEFVKNMNEKAKYLQMNDTQYKDPAGLDDSGYSSAFDLAVIASYAMKNKQFSDIVKTTDYTINSVDGKLSHKLTSSNRLIKQDESLFYSNANGIKTGFTPTAGHCLVSSAIKDNRELVGVILNTNESTVDASAKESKKLLQWGFDNFLF